MALVDSMMTNEAAAAADCRAAPVGGAAVVQLHTEICDLYYGTPWNDDNMKSYSLLGLAVTH